MYSRLVVSLFASLVARQVFGIPTTSAVEQINATECAAAFPDCECEADSYGGVSILCGSVPSTSPTNVSTDAPTPKRRWAAVDLSTDVDEGGSADLPHTSLIEKREIIIDNVQYPLMQAFAIVGIANIYHGFAAVVRNRFPNGDRNKFITGLTGKLKQAVTVNGRRFAAGAIWTIRYDYAEGAQNGLEGAHVNVALGKGNNEETWGIYLRQSPLGTSNWYWDHVLQLTNYVKNRMNPSTPWDPDQENWEQKEELADLVSQFWHSIWNEYKDTGTP